jgi:hypothetical protein
MQVIKIQTSEKNYASYYGLQFPGGTPGAASGVL